LKSLTSTGSQYGGNMSCDFGGLTQGAWETKVPSGKASGEDLGMQ